PSRVRRALLVALRPRPADRFDSMNELLDALEAGAQPLWMAPFRRNPTRAKRARAEETAAHETGAHVEARRDDAPRSSLSAMADALLPLVERPPSRVRATSLRARVGVALAAACAIAATIAVYMHYRAPTPPSQAPVASPHADHERASSSLA